MTQTIGRGGTIRLDANYQDGTGTLVDPANPLVDILDPDNVAVVTDAAPTKQSTGVYFYDHAVAVDADLGTWSAHWTGTINGAPVSGDDEFVVVAAGEVGFEAEEAPDYATTAELRARLGPMEDQLEEEILQLAITAASRAVEDFTGEQFWLNTSIAERIFAAEDRDTVKLSPPLGTTSGLIVATDDAGDGTFGTTWLDTDYTLLPRNASADGEPWRVLSTSITGTRTFPAGNGRVKVTGKFGWPAVPKQVKQAVLFQASRLFASKDTPFGVVDLANTEAAVRLLANLDVNAQVLLRPLIPGSALVA